MKAELPIGARDERQLAELEKMLEAPPHGVRITGAGSFHRTEIPLVGGQEPVRGRASGENALDGNGETLNDAGKDLPRAFRPLGQLKLALF